MEHKRDCICNGTGWVWGHELPHDSQDFLYDLEYESPLSDDTKYFCPFGDEESINTD